MKASPCQVLPRVMLRRAHSHSTKGRDILTVIPDIPGMGESETAKIQTSFSLCIEQGKSLSIIEIESIPPLPSKNSSNMRM